jgi:hypothetical protein
MKPEDADVDWGQVAGSCDHGNEPSESIKGEEYFDRLLKKELVRPL